MVTKKYIKRMIKLFDSLRGPSKVGMRKVINPFIKAINESVDSNNEKDMNLTIHSSVYQTFYETVMIPNTYYTQKILDAAIKFFEENIRSI